MLFPRERVEGIIGVIFVKKQFEGGPPLRHQKKKKE